MQEQPENLTNRVAYVQSCALKVGHPGDRSCHFSQVLKPKKKSKPKPSQSADITVTSSEPENASVTVEEPQQSNIAINVNYESAENAQVNLQKNGETAEVEIAESAQEDHTTNNSETNGDATAVANAECAQQAHDIIAINNLVLQDDIDVACEAIPSESDILTKDAQKAGSSKIINYEDSQIRQDKTAKEDQWNFERFLEMNKQILYTLDNIESITAQPKTVAEIEQVDSLEIDVFDIRPYTVQQLNALYYNSELDVLDDFTKTYVDAELKGLHLKKHYLYELLANYLKIREKITGNNIEIEQLRKEYRNLQLEIWTVDTTTIQGSAQCQDGRLLSTSHEFNRSIFHRSAFQNVNRILGKVQKLVFDNHVLFSYSCEELRLQIDLYIEQIIGNVLAMKQLSSKSPVSLAMQDESPYLKAHINEIRQSISVLFAFQRKLITDTMFLKDSRGWLTKLVAVLIRVANYQDHLFLIHHILRCPAGVGTWAAAFIQVPLDLPVEEPFANYQINHILSLLSVILSPVRERKEFLKDIVHCQNVPSETNWVLVDSDGEEDDETGISLRENDLVAIFNQLPLGDMFRSVLLINTRDGKDQYNSDIVTQQHILRCFAFSSVILRLLHCGLETYCQPKYNQFSKRLSRFIRHIVQYTTDQWELFLKRDNLSDRAMIQRLQTEYDAFFLRAIYYLYSSQKLRAWQFLAVVPYNIVTIKTLWKIYYFLHMPDDKAEDIMDFSLNADFRKMIWESDLRNQFEEKLNNLGDAEVYYLLNTFANMSLARSEADIDFIYSSTMDILQVGFVSQVTQDTCSKSARILLTHLTSKHPCLLSSILKTVQENLDKIGGFALYLYEDIPLSIWILSDDDLEIIERLLLRYPVNSDQTKLARMILSRLNWDILPYEKHCETAMLVLKAVDQEATYSQWGWQTILRLRLHISDRHFQELGRVYEVERSEILLKGVRENQPLPCFVAILMTTWGHLVPLICSNGLNQLLTLQLHQKHEVVLFALYQIIPIFITCQECIINCNKYQEILSNLLNADRGYISYAKSFIMTQNTVLQQFGNMVETQIVNYAFYNLNSPRLLVRLWMNSLVSIPNWNKDNAILYLLDVVIRASFFHQDSLQIIYDNFRDLYQATTPQESSSSIIGIFKWASGGSNNSNSLLSNSLASYPWLAYIFLEIEHQEKEAKTGLWMGTLEELAKQKGKINVDHAIKNAASGLRMSAFSSSFLCIYRWAQQAMDTDMNHPLLPLFWQKFFILYLTRLPGITYTDKVCVGDKFFEGLVNFAFLKRIKRRLQETLEFYGGQMESKENSDKAEHLKLRYNIFQAFLLWLEEPRLQSGNLLLQSLPVQYQPRLLSLIIQEESQVPWYEYLDHNQIINDQTKAIKLWKVANFREKSHVNQPLSNPGHGIESTDPVERILRRLTSYDAIKVPPEIQRKSINLTQIDFSNKENMFRTLKVCFDTINRFAHDHSLSLSEQRSLNSGYQELLPQLFSSVLKRIKKQVPCKGKNQTVLCSGPATITLEIQEAKRNDRIDHEMQINRQSYESLLDKCLKFPHASLYTASVSIQQCVQTLQHQIKTNPETAELGVELFYYVLPLLQEEIASYLPAKSLFVNCIEKLGQSHICGVEYEMPRLLEWILKQPNLGNYLAPYFLPSNTGTANMLLMYSTITKEMAKKYDVIFALVSKFEIEKWLKDKHPNLSQRSQIIKNIIDALSALGCDPPMDALMLHGLYRKHLLTVFEHQFPEHYGEIFSLLLKASNGTPENNLIAESVWIDVLNLLANPAKIHPKAPIRDQLRQYAQHQKMLSHQELLETADMLARHFTQERLSYGLYGLYPKCRKYMDIYVLLLGMTGHGIVLSMLNTHQGILGDRLSEKIWPYIRELFTPWLIPYSMHNLKENMATWIQQLADDRPVLLPWIPSDKEFAQKMISIFCECIGFILDTLPASSIILNYLWQWYVVSFGHPSIKNHVLMPIHSAFTMLQWNNFWPSMVDLELMTRVVDQYLPECHAFLGHIFISIPWLKWINSFTGAPQQIKAKVYHCFLSLLVKLSIEPNIRKNHKEKTRSLLIQAENFDWSILEPAVFQHIMDWVLMSCDCTVIFKSDVLDLDYRLMSLLKVASGYNEVWPFISPDLTMKRQIYVRTHIKLLSAFISKNRNLQNTSEAELCKVINRYITEVETVVTTTAEMEIILKEICAVVNIVEISPISTKVLTRWINSKPYGLVVKTLLKTLGTSVIDYKHLAGLLEATLTSYFNNSAIESNLDEPSWKKARDLICVSASRPIDFEQVLINDGSILTLNALLLQRVQKNTDSENLLNHSIGYMEKIKMRESIESKVPLLWFSIIKLALRHCEKDEAVASSLLYKFSQILLQISEESGSAKWSRGLLSAIGLTKSESVTINFRFISRALAGYILAQLPEMKAAQRKVRIAANSPCVVGMPGGNCECPKVLLDLDFRQSQGQIKDCAVIALANIQDPSNSLHNAHTFLWMLLKQFYIKPYLKEG